MKPLINIYTSLRKTPISLHAYFDNRSFYDLLDSSQYDLQKISAVEMIFDVEKSENSANSIPGLYDIINTTILDLRPILIVSESPQPRNKIKSYKGIFWGMELKGAIYQEFASLDPNLSFFVGMVDLKNLSEDNLSRFIYNSSYCFITYVPKSIELSNTYLEALKDFYDPRFGINYFKLITIYCGESNRVVMRVGGDGGRSYFSLQYFLPSNHRNQIVKKLSAGIAFA